MAEESPPESVIVSGEDPLAADIVIVPVKAVPPLTAAGEKDKPVTLSPVRLTVAVLVEDPRVAVKVSATVLATRDEVIEKVAEVCPAPMVTVEG